MAQEPILKSDQRPWGGYLVLEENRSYKVKRLTVQPQKRLSLQKHNHRSEHWFILFGTAKITRGNQELILKRGDSIDIPTQATHRIENIGQEPLEIIEIQTGSYFGEDDIIRIEDDFGRLNQE
jgi:mannose-6-phosphate isomerase-like protein (cupin superfamily)